MANIKLRDQEPPSWQPKILEITFQTEEEFNAFLEFCGWNVTVSNARKDSGSFVVTGNASRDRVSSILGDCHQAMQSK